jgi:Tfp pilus assembly protein PilP
MRTLAFVTFAAALAAAPLAARSQPTAEKPAHPKAAALQQPPPAPPAKQDGAPKTGQPAPTATAGEKPATPPVAAQLPAPEAYTYRPDGRRDPFLSLHSTGTNTPASSRRGEGAAGLAVADISVRGVMQSRGSLVAMIMGPDNKTYIVHQGDKLLDGTIRTITPQGLVVVQEVNDPLSLVKQREVRKLLRSLEDAKE